MIRTRRSDALKLKVQTVTQKILPQGDGATAMLGFNGSMPGPEIRLKRGTEGINRGPDCSARGHGRSLARHLSGKPDGRCADAVQELINPVDSKTYSFKPPDESTY